MQADDDRRQDQRAPVVDSRQQQEIGDEGANHVEGAVREIDDVEHAEDDGEAEAQKRVERAVDEADHQLAVEHLRADHVAEDHHGRGSKDGSRQ